MVKKPILRSNMKWKLLAVCAGLLLCLSTPVQASPYIYSFSSPTGYLGSSHTYTSNGVSITATGYNSNGTTTGLYSKNDGGSEVGLGIANAVQNEINTANFVQLNLTNLLATNPSGLNMSIGSVQSGEGWALFGSNTAGMLGTEIMSGNTNYPSGFAVSGLGGYHYLGVQATSGNVLVSTLSSSSVAAPEPATYLILGSTLAMAGFLKIKSARKKLQSAKK